MRGFEMAMTAALAIAIVGAGSAVADELRIVKGSFPSRGDQSPNSDLLALFTVDGSSHKVAALGAAIHHLDANQPSDQLLVGFYDKDEWQKFVRIWQQARRAKRPTEAEVYSHKNEIGSYFDPNTHASVTVSLATNGDIDFAVVGKPDANNLPTVITLIELIPIDFKDFDENVATVTAYFAK